MKTLTSEQRLGALAVILIALGAVLMLVGSVAGGAVGLVGGVVLWRYFGQKHKRGTTSESTVMG